MTAAIEAIQLTRRFGDFTAVNALSISVETGEIFGLLGPNGAGKTTAIKMLTGLMQPSEGTARIAGFDVEREPEQVKRRLGYMSQLFSLYPDLTVEIQMTLVTPANAARPGRALDAWRRSSMSPFIRRPARHMWMTSHATDAAATMASGPSSHS